MDYIEMALMELKALQGKVQSEIIKDLIEGHASSRRRMVSLYERYKGTSEGVPVLTRTFEDENKINNKLNNDFISDIVDTKVGYFAGQPISYMLDKTRFKVSDGEKEILRSDYEERTKLIADFMSRNNIEDLDAETAKMATICGYGARLCYVGKDAQEYVMNILPWETVFITDISINEPQYAMRYYKVKVRPKPGAEWVEKWRVEWYDDKYITFYIENDNHDFVLDDGEPVNPLPHLFDDVPLFGFPNNEELQGDCEKVLNLIDGYDNTLSDVNSEIEQFRLAYLATYGINLDEDTLEKARKTGAFGFPDKECKMEFITKMLDDSVVEHHLDRLEDNIMRFAKSVNFSDEKFAGQQSGISLRYKMLALESKCIVAERKFAAALSKMFKILATAWKTKGIEFDHNDIYFKFTRNFPLNLMDEAQTTSQLRGNVSELTRLSLLSFVDNPEYEMKLMEQEEEIVDVDRFNQDGDPGEEDEE